MIQSMTGFGRGMYRDEEMNITIEIKAVNNRYAEIQVRSPRRYAFAEEHLRSAVKARLLRGKIEVSLHVDLFGTTDKSVEVNGAVAEEYYRAYRELADKLNLPEHQISLSMIASQEGVMTAVTKEEDEEAFLAKMDKALHEALDDIEAMRTAEGARLAADLLHRADVIEGIKNKIKALRSSSEARRTFRRIASFWKRPSLPTRRISRRSSSASRATSRSSALSSRARRIPSARRWTSSSRR